MATNWTSSKDELLKYITIEDNGTLRLSYHPSIVTHRQGMIIKKGTPTLTIGGVVYFMRSLNECLGIATAPPQYQYRDCATPAPCHQVTMQLVKKLKQVSIYANETSFCLVTKDASTVCYKSTRFDDLQIDFDKGLIEVYQTVKL